jgi:hypothetical protein
MWFGAFGCPVEDFNLKAEGGRDNQEDVSEPFPPLPFPAISHSCEISIGIGGVSLKANLGPAAYESGPVPLTNVTSSPK